MHEIEKDFTEYLYNRYVEAERKNDFDRGRIYEDLLDRCIYTLTSRKYSTIRRYAKELQKKISSARKNGTTSRLRLVGEEGKREFEKMIKEYRQSLIEEGIPEEIITGMVMHRKNNYDND